MARRGGGEGEVAERHRKRLAEVAVSPWPGEAAAGRAAAGRAAAVDGEQGRALERLFQATGGRGLPMPGGFLLDPVAIEARVALPGPRPGWKVALAYHPRFGVIIGAGSGHGRLYAIEYPAEPGSLEPPRFHESNDVGRNWDELLDYLVRIEDAQRMAYAVWIGIGEPYGDRRAMSGRWSPLRHVIYARNRDRLHGLAARLSAVAARDGGAGGVYVRGGEVVVASVGADVLVACADADDLAHALEYANEHGLTAMPEAWGGEIGYARSEPPTQGVVYELSGVERRPAFRLTAAREGNAFVWSMIQDDGVLGGQRVGPGRVPASAVPVLGRASPRLLRYFGRLGVSRVPALASVEGVRRWAAENDAAQAGAAQAGAAQAGAARGWERLVDIEAEAGGLIFGAQWGLSSPDRLGPYLVLSDRESLAGLNEAMDAADPDAPAGDRERLPWPFVRRKGIELCVIGRERARIHSAICADREGTIYFLDNEFMGLSPLATSVTGMLEKRALWQELWGFGLGLARSPALAIEASLDAKWAASIGLAAVPEASDAVSAWYLGDGAALVSWSEHPAQRAESTLYVDGAARAVEIARALRDRQRRATIYVRHNQGNQDDAERWAALQAAGIEGLERRDWTSWGFR